MPIKFDSTKRGFFLDNPSEEELEAIKKIAVDYITLSLGKMAALNFIKAMSEENAMKDGELDAMTTESTMRH